MTNLTSPAPNIHQGVEAPLPSFLLAGGMRCGSTTLWSMLAGHPSLFFPATKELHFFDDRDGAYRRGLGWYRQQFASAQPDAAIGEATPEYLYLAAARERIVADLPGVKLVVILRDPIKRALSHYWFRVYRGQEQLSLAAALDAEESRLEAAASDWERHLFAYRTFSMYAQPLDQWRTLVGPDRVCTLFLEELLSQPARELRRVMEFLDVPQLDPNGTATMNHRNKIAYPRSISVQRWCQRWIRWGDAGASLRHRATRRLGRAVRKLNVATRRPPIPAAALDRLRLPLRSDQARLAEILGRSLPWST